MKKLILSIFALILFFGFWFTVDYVDWCLNWEIEIDWEQYNCKSCDWTKHQWSTDIGDSVFYKKCCLWTPYYEEDNDWDNDIADLCCEEWNEVYQKQDWYWDCRLSCEWDLYWRNLDMCCPVWWVTYNPANNGNPKDCCEWKMEGEEVCCSYGTAFTGWSCVSCEILETIPSWWQANCDAGAAWCQWELYTWSNWVQQCCPGMMVPDENDELVCITNTEWDMWINMNTECLINWQCSYNIYETLGIRKSDPDPSVTKFVQDIVLWVTMFIGTVVSVILVVSWVLYIMAGIQGNETLASTAKKGIVNSLIWLLLVVASYSIVRLIQFLATAWWG